MFDGIEYRSRLEARWAAFFGRIGWHYTYEPFDGDGYIPDFLIHGDRPLLVEVKPAVSPSDFAAPVRRAVTGLADHWQNDVLIVGVDPFPRLPSSFDDVPAAGWLGEFVGCGWDWASGLWFTCTECQRTNVFHDVMTYAGRPCGHYEGDHLLGAADLPGIRAAWAAATNDVKWRGKQATPAPRPSAAPDPLELIAVEGLRHYLGCRSVSLDPAPIQAKFDVTPSQITGSRLERIKEILRTHPGVDPVLFRTGRHLLLADDRLRIAYTPELARVIAAELRGEAAA